MKYLTPLVVVVTIITCNARRIIREGSVDDGQPRRQFGYSASITHFTPGDDKHHAQSEINVNMDHEPIIRNRIRTQDLTTKASVGYLNYEAYKPESSKSYKATKVQPDAGQNSFNVGYSIGFGNTPNEPRPVYEAPRYIPTEIVTGTPNGKVAKPSEVQPKDYVLNVMEDLQKQGIRFPKPEENKPQFAALVAAPPYHKETQQYHKDTQQYHKETQQYHKDTQQYHKETQPKYHKQQPLYHKEQYHKEVYEEKIPIYKPNEESSYGWKNLSPTLEIAGSGIITSPPRKQSSRSKQNYQSVSYSEKPEGSEQRTFDHAQAIGHSQGFDYSNAVNIDYQDSSSTQQVSSTPRYMTEPNPTSYQNGPVQIDKTLLENFYSQYKPVSLNWFQNHDALPETKNEEPTKDVKPIYTMDTRLLQSMPYLSNKPIDTTLIQKMINSNSDAGALVQNPSQPNSVYAFPQSTTDATNEIENVQNGHQFPVELYSQQEPKHYHHVISHEQRNDNYQPHRYNQEKSMDKPKNHRHHQHRYQESTKETQKNHQEYNRYQESSDSHGSHSTQVNTIVPVEQIIKGKPKKPGVVRHPRVLLNSNDSYLIATNIASSNSHPTSSAQFYDNLDTALRPPPINYVLPKIE